MKYLLLAYNAMHYSHGERYVFIYVQRGQGAEYEPEWLNIIVGVHALRLAVLVYMHLD